MDVESPAKLAGVDKSKVGRRTQVSRRAAAEERLLDAALEIVAKRGSIRMTLADVGEMAGYSRSLAAHCFGSKEGLLRRLAMHISMHFEAMRQDSPKRYPGLDALRGGIGLYFDSTKDYSAETRAMLVMMTEALLDDSALREDIAGYNRQVLVGLETNIRIGQLRGEIRSELDPQATAALIMGSMRGVMLQHFLHDEGTGPELMKRMLLDIVDSYVAEPAKKR